LCWITIGQAPIDTFVRMKAHDVIVHNNVIKASEQHSAKFSYYFSRKYRQEH